MTEPIRKLNHPDPDSGRNTFELGSGSQGSDVRGDLRDVASAARGRISDFSSHAVDFAEEASRRISRLGQTIHQRAPGWKRDIGLRMDEARYRLRQAARDVDATARRRPVQAITIAAVCGLVFGLSWRIWRYNRG